MESVRNAYYVKLGKGGKWADSSIQAGIIRIGWREQTLDDVNNWRESIIRQETLSAREQEGLPTSKTAVANDVSALSKIVHATPEDVWITFHGPCLWWCRVAETGIEEDATSKYRRVAGQWSHCDIAGTPLIVNEIPGRLSKIQGFRGTICSLGPSQVDDLRRLLT
jgi:hypothetical protein